MKRVWSKVDSSTYMVNRAIGTVKRRKLNSFDFPIPGLNEDVWCETLKHCSPEQSTILRMVCKYFRIERFVVKVNGKEKPVKKVCKEAIISTNNPNYIRELPGIRLTPEKLRVIKTTCYQEDAKVEVFKYAVSCGIPMKPSDWYDLALKGSPKALEWVKSLPIHWVTSRKNFMPGLFVRGDKELISEFWRHLKYHWTEDRIYCLMDSKLTEDKGLRIIYNHLIGHDTIPELGDDKTFAICVISHLILSEWYGVSNPTKRAEALEMIEELARVLDDQQRYNGETYINFSMLESTCKSFQYDQNSILFKLLRTGNVVHAHLIWTHIKFVIPVIPLLRALIACPFDTRMMIRAVHQYVMGFTEDKKIDLRDNPNHIMNHQVVYRVRNSVFGHAAVPNPDNLECYRLYPEFPTYQPM